MNREELMKSLETGERAEPLGSWAPRAAAIMLTLSLRSNLIKSDPDQAIDIMRQVCAMMPPEVLLSATLGMAQAEATVQKMNEEGISIEMYEEIDEALRGVNTDDQ